jgi:hypothetical protein
MLSSPVCEPIVSEVVPTPRIVTYDTEFIEDGTTIDLISIAAVDDQGLEFYAISTEFDADKANDWVKENVLPKLPPRSDPRWMSRAEIKANLYWFLVGYGPVELWAYFGAYDHVAMAQLWGPMIDLRSPIPMFTHELMQLWEDAGQPPMPPQGTDQHDALADAHWNMDLYRECRVVSSRV